MITNYLKVAVRNLRKNKGYALINVVGLAVGIAVCVLIFRYVSHELSYDRYHEKADRTYRITLELPQIHLAVTPSMLSPSLQRLFPEVESGVRIWNAGSSQALIVRNEDRVFEEYGFAYADSSLFEVFNFDLLAGDPETALVRPRSLVISRDMSRKYFGSINPLGRSLEVNGTPYEVTGVMENIPRNSHFRFDFFASMTTRSGWSELSDDSWRSANFFTYIVLDEGVSAAALKEKADAYIAENIPDNDFVSQLDMRYEPLTDIHLFSETDIDIAAQGDIRYVLAASAIAVLILIIACINYMNLATARSARRSREVGIRKVLGSDRRGLIGQFYGEAAFLTLLAIGCSILLIEISLPWFNSITGQALAVDYTSLSFWGMMGGIALLVTLVAGSYPALMLSSFKPAEVLKGGRSNTGDSRLRRGLVVFQFAASIFLIIGTLVIFRQIDYIQQKELGYKQDNVLVLNVYNEVERSFDVFNSRLQEIAGVEGSAMASETPTSIRGGYGIDVEGLEEGQNFQLVGMRINSSFTEVLNINLVAGEGHTQGDFLRANPDSGEARYAFLANESLAHHYGVAPEELVGRQTVMSGRRGIIKGVMRDFHFTSLHRDISPLVLFPQDGYDKLMISFTADDVQRTVEETRAAWSEMFPDLPFEYQFLDQEYEALYRQETRAGQVFTSFSALAIFIACLGLVGLASYMVERRTREIGVRKVLGASVRHILALFSRDFLVLVGIGFLIAVPLGWYAMNQWLQNFAYRIDPGVTLFVAAGAIAMVIALVTVSYQAFRAARLDPVESLKTE